jgi:hypothetical protein
MWDVRTVFNEQCVRDFLAREGGCLLVSMDGQARPLLKRRRAFKGIMGWTAKTRSSQKEGSGFF